MGEWSPISLSELSTLIEKAELDMAEDLLSLWNLVRTTPQKWTEESYGTEGNGFWVVAISGQRVIWYNDIEEGFNISKYQEYGVIEEYAFEQDELHVALLKLSKMGRGVNDSLNRGAPKPLD